ncbi:MAG TPA: transketolase [Hyphomicrobiaceae bacterium]|nr:transketolase [Hyphomicrobiaceae bacterium]
MSASVTDKDLANALRALAMDGVQAANSGHPGMPMGMADVASVLFRDVMKYDAAQPDWPDRDRFVLSAGHGSMLLYGLLYLTGYPGMELQDLKDFRQLGAKTAGHPEYGHAAGIETTTGPLGQGIANAVGFAIAEKLLAARHGTDIVDHRTYVIAGDGCLMEGISQEAISLAGHLKLSKLIVLFDDNSISIDGATSMATSEDQIRRFEASGWRAERIDGHDPAAIRAALSRAYSSDRPSMIACKTTIGFGSPNKAGKASAHGEPLGPDEIKLTKEKLGWPHGSFEIPADVLAAWRAAGRKGADARKAWEARAAKIDRSLLTDPVTSAIATKIAETARATASAFIADKAKLATRQSSQKVLEALMPVVPQLIGGSADLTGSNGTKTKHHTPVSPSDFKANYMHYGVREHGMAAAMNGMALHGGIVPYGATFLVFTDYCRPSIRLSALMGQRVIYVMTHDSIGLGEDGPTHQPVEHLAALRVIPNTLVFRPADAVEVAECWEIALTTADKPSVLALTRQGLPTLRSDAKENLSRKGGYVLATAGTKRDVTLIASGSEVSLAVEARAALEAVGIGAAVVSVPSLELFAAQAKAYRDEVLGGAPRIIVEAAMQQSWDRYLRDGDAFVGMSGFGASGPAAKLYEHFGITAKAVADAAKKAVGKA